MARKKTVSPARKRPRSTTATPRAVAVSGVLPPHAHAEAYDKVTVVLFRRQVAFLDRLSITIREQSGGRVHRAEILRALVDFLQELDPDPGGLGSEEKMREVLVATIGK